MKKEYSVPTIEINEFHTDDVITMSITDVDDNSGYDWGDIT